MYVPAVGDAAMRAKHVRDMQALARQARLDVEQPSIHVFMPPDIAAAV